MSISFSALYTKSRKGRRLTDLGTEGPALTLLTLAGSLAFLAGAVVSDRRNSLYALLLLMASFPVRSLFRSSR
jgi:hypothetical protein